MERWVERLLPYWSIGINALLGLTLLAGSGDAGNNVYGKTYATLMSAVSEVLAAAAR